MLKHLHLLVRAEVSRPPQNLDEIHLWIENLVDGLGMNIIYGPFAMRSDVKDNEGITAGCVLSTSHCMIHTWDHLEVPVVQLDVYTCSDLDVSYIEESLQGFEPIKIEYKFLDREGGLTELSSK